MSSANRLISIFEMGAEIVAFQADIASDPRRKAALTDAHHAMTRGKSIEEVAEQFTARLAD